MSDGANKVTSACTFFLYFILVTLSHFTSHFTWWPNVLKLDDFFSFFSPIPICTQRGLQDGGVFVAVNCPFVVSL